MSAIVSITEVRVRNEQKKGVETWARVKEPVWFPAFRLWMRFFPHLEFPIDPCIRKSGRIIKIERIPGSDIVLYTLFFVAAGKHNTSITRSFDADDIEVLGPKP